MSAANPPPRQPIPGRLASTILDLIAREAEVLTVEPVSAHFSLITIGGQDFRARRWSPGDMVQIVVAGATSALGLWEHRSYTPLSFDAEAGRMQILAFLHGHGVGSAWCASARPGTRCHLVGPRSALSLKKAGPSAIFFGDETSFSTAAAFRDPAAGLRDVKYVFEVSSLEESRAVLDRVGLTDEVKLVAREAGDSHLAQVEREVLDLYRATPSAHGFFTGKAASIQRLYTALRAGGVSARQVTNYAYWAPGREGFSGVPQ